MPVLCVLFQGDVENQTVFARYIRKEIVEADEPNLLDEEGGPFFSLLSLLIHVLFSKLSAEDHPVMWETLMEFCHWTADYI